ncbi:MAG: putative Ig domain-containing protein [Oleiphilaceae bacterium]|nr:putative Ig domain-containing protein [Oleiphilaceae bacterium]
MDEPYSYTLQAMDPDGDSLTWELLSGPSGMTLNAITGALTWTPTQAGVQQVTVTVTDSKGATAGSTFGINVTGDTALPRLGNVPRAQAEVDKPYVYRVVAIDADGFAVDLQILSAPEGMVLADENGIPTIRWTPAEGDCVKSVTLELEDRFGQTAEAQWDIQVLAAPKKLNRVQCSAQSEACGG